MSTNAPRPTPTTTPSRNGDARPRRSATHDYWPRDFWDVAPESATEQRPHISDWASI